MAENYLVKLFEHNNWANDAVIQACSTLSDEQLDAVPPAAAYGNLRATLLHLVGAQQGYLSLLTLPVEARRRVYLSFAELRESAHASGEGLLALAREEPSQARIQTTDGFYVEPWVVMVQIINHATEHREQINSMLTVLGVKPLELDGWMFGEATGALNPISD